MSLMLKNALLFNQTKPDELAQYIFSEINLFSKKIEKMLSLENIWWGGYQNNIFQSCKMQQRMLLQTTYYILHIAVCSALCCMVYWNVVFQIKKCYLWWDFHGPMNSSNTFKNKDLVQKGLSMRNGCMMSISSRY